MLFSLFPSRVQFVWAGMAIDAEGEGPNLHVALEAGAEALRDAPGGRILRRDETDERAPAELAVGIFAHPACRLGGKASAVAIRHQAPNHLRLRPAFRFPQSAVAHEPAASLVLDGQRAIAAQCP